MVQRLWHYDVWIVQSVLGFPEKVLPVMNSSVVQNRHLFKSYLWWTLDIQLNRFVSSITKIA